MGDGRTFGTFNTADSCPPTPRRGQRNDFLISRSRRPVSISAGAHTLTLVVVGGDPFGVEFDAVSFEPAA